MSSPPAPAPRPVEDDQLQGDKLSALKRVDEDVRCLQRIYTDLAYHAEDQEDRLDTLESQMADANQDSKSAAEQIEQSKYGYDRSIKRRLYIFGTGVAFLFVAVMTFWPSS